MQARRMTRDDLLERQRWRRKQTESSMRRGKHADLIDSLLVAAWLLAVVIAIVIGEVRS